MKKSFTLFQSSVNQILSSSKLVFLVLTITHLSKAQVQPTFTCTSIQVTSTLSSNGDITTGQDLNVSGNINLQGNLMMTPSSTANIGALNMSGAANFNNSIIAPGLTNGTGYQPVYVSPSGALVTAFGPTGPLFPSTSCGQLANWHIGGTNFGGMGLSDPSIGTCDNFPFGIKTNNVARMYFSDANGNNAGNIGFGTTSPTERFHFFGGNMLLDGTTAPAGSLFKVVVNNNSVKAICLSNIIVNPLGYENFVVYGDGKTIVGYMPGSSNNARLNVNLNGGEAFNIYDQITNKVNFAVMADGSTYIGAKRPIPLPAGIHGNAMLSVDGKILAKEIYVNIHNSVWPDYMFDKNHKLITAKEEEDFYLKNHHLKDVPSAEEVKENGINVTDMFAVFLQKIEGLTLRSVAQDKRIVT